MAKQHQSQLIANEHQNHPQPDRPRTPDRTDSDITSPHPDQSHWSIDNLPSVLYALRPGTQYIKSRARVRETPHKIFNKHVRDFPVLPSRISSKVEGWRLEAWFRLDRRIEAQDILDRVNPRFRSEVSSLEIELRREEFRRLFHVADWKSQASINEVARVVHKRGVDLGLNTTRGVTPGLVDPERGEKGGRIPVPAGQKREKTGVVASWPFFVMQGVRKQSMKSEACFWPSGSKGYPLELGARTANGGSGEAQVSHSQGFGGQPSRSVSSVPSARKAWVEDYVEQMSQKKRKQTKPRRISAAYPETRELASHDNSLVFRETSYDRGTMTLEEYLHRNRMSYEEYLCRDEDAKKSKVWNSEKTENGAGTQKRNVVDPWLVVS